MPISVLCVGELLVYVFVGLGSGFSMGASQRRETITW